MAEPMTLEEAIEEAEHELKVANEAECFTTELSVPALHTFLAAAKAREGEVIPMVLHCPKCGHQHIDHPSPEWDNPPHRSHLYHVCGCIWRSADVPTTGVAATKTRGKADTWPVAIREIEEPASE